MKEDTYMTTTSEPSIGERLSKLASSGVDTLIIGAPDVNGVFRTKRFALDLFCREDVEVAFSDYVFAADIQEELMTPRPGYQGYFPTAALGLPDVYVRPDWSLLRVLPWDTRTALVLGDFYTHGGDELAISPRGVLKRVIERLGRLGLHAMAGCEYEFFIFRGSPEDVRNHVGNLTPLSTGPAYGYGRGSDDEAILGNVRRMMEAAGIPVESANPEAAPGQSEITIRYANVLAAADYAFLYKQFVGELLARDGMTASFIAKLDKDGYGSSGHLHISLRDDSGEPQMVDLDDSLSATTHSAIGGFLETMAEFSSLYAPNVNSYRRYQSDYSFAGDTIAWGVDNRTCGVRLIHAGRNGTRLEARTPGADMNPYLALAAALAGIGHGLEQKLSSPPAVDADAYAEPGVQRVPNDLNTALGLLDNSAVARDWLGDEFVNFYVETRFWEAEQHRLAVTEWELRRYL